MSGKRPFESHLTRTSFGKFTFIVELRTGKVWLCWDNNRCWNNMPSAIHKFNWAWRLVSWCSQKAVFSKVIDLNVMMVAQGCAS